MKEFLQKIKLIDHLSLTLPMSRRNFEEKLTSVTKEGNIGPFSAFSDIFTSDEFEYVGQVNFNSFKIRRRQKMFDSNNSWATVNGSYKEKNGQVEVESEINGFGTFFIVFLVVFLLFYVVIAFFILMNDGPGIVFLFLLLHGILMFLIPYFVMRRSVKRMKHELEREFYYFTKQ